MSRQTLSFLLISGVIILAILAAATLAPFPLRPASSQMMSDLGYYAFCPFAPYSTLTLLMLAGLGWVVRRYVQTQGRP